MTHTIEVKDLNKCFADLHAVNNVTLTVERGDVLGFLGPNGAGKSTTMKMISGFLEPTSGQITICGCDMRKHPMRAKRALGYLPEGAPAYGEMTPASFLEFIAAIRGLRGRQKRERIAEVTDRIYLKEVLKQPIETLSKGFKRRVGIAQAILHDPQALVLDEPTDGLDPNQKDEMRILIREMAETKAIIISTHILEEVDAICSRAVIIADGQIVFSGTPNELASRSRYYNAVYLTLGKIDVATVKLGLQKIGGIAGIEDLAPRAGAPRMLIRAHEGRSIIAPISDLIHSSSWNISEIHVDPGRLDEVFRKITTKHNTEGVTIHT